MEITKCVTICALNACPVCKLPWFWRPRTIKSKKSLNSVKFRGFCVKLWKSWEFADFPTFLRESAIRVEMVENTYGKPIGFQRFGASARNRTRFRGKCIIHRILQKS